MLLEGGADFECILTNRQASGHDKHQFGGFIAHDERSPRRGAIIRNEKHPLCLVLCIKLQTSSR